MRPTRLIQRTLCAALLLSGLSTPAWAAWPNDKPIEFVVGFSAGGGQDLMIRTLQPYLEKALKAKIVVSNKPGAGGELAYTTLAQAPADGYTVSTLSVPSFMTMQISRKVKFDPADIAPVARLVEDPTVFVVNAKSSIKNLSELAAQAKAKPGSVSLGGSGVGTDDHLASMLFRNHGVNFTYVPYPGGADSWVALMGNHVTMAAASTNIPGREPGLRAVAVLDTKRNAMLPDVPTGREQGFDVVMTSERGMGMHAKVPADIRRRMSEAVAVALADPEFQAKAKQVNLVISYMDGEPWSKVFKERRDQYQKIWDATPWSK